MNLKRAIKIAQQKNPKLKPTKNGYMYKGDYYLEFVSSDYDEEDGAVYDNFFKINTKTGEVTRYNPIIDGVPDPNEIKPLWR